MSKMQEALDLLIRTPASEVVRIAQLCGFYDEPDTNVAKTEINEIFSETDFVYSNIKNKTIADNQIIGTSKTKINTQMILEPAA